MLARRAVTWGGKPSHQPKRAAAVETLPQPVASTMGPTVRLGLEGGFSVLDHIGAALAHAEETGGAQFQNGPDGRLLAVSLKQAHGLGQVEGVNVHFADGFQQPWELWPGPWWRRWGFPT